MSHIDKLKKRRESHCSGSGRVFAVQVNREFHSASLSILLQRERYTETQWLRIERGSSNYFDVYNIGSFHGGTRAMSMAHQNDREVQFAAWTDKERHLCKLLYPDFEALRRAMPKRSISSIRGQCSRLGLTSKTYHFWTATEIDRLRRLYPRATWEELLKVFPFATQRMILSIAQTRGIRRLRRSARLAGRA